ncbi:MAG: sensor histidine kinase [Bacteroidota bacterium]|nr:sensor histidine kinase [Bacteroidota bacterium]
MSFSAKLNTFGSLGVKASYLPWEIYLTRKLNLLSLMGTINITLALIVFLSFGYTDFIIECVSTLIAAPFVVLLNVKRNYIWASYLFYFIGVFLFASLNLKMGIDSYGILLYFPILISLIQMLGRKETFSHMTIIAVLYFITISLVLYGNKHNYLLIHIDAPSLLNLKIINILMSFFTGIILISVITIEANKQEAQIKNMVNEKEVLIAEVFHRVKNNMNIVTSLLNLKKHASQSEEVKEALEECRNRVFSMALVHQKIYNNKNITTLNFKSYTNELVKESLYSYGGEESADIQIDAEDVELQLPYAVPCGLILNELITNSFKHGKTEGKKLQIKIALSSKDGMIDLLVKDNGPGIAENASIKKDSLGMELIRSLSEQIDGQYSFTNEKGFTFSLRFKN